MFFKKAVTSFICLVIASSGLLVALFKWMFVDDALLPVNASVIPWKFETITDVEKGGSSSIAVNDSTNNISFQYVMKRDVEYPHVTVVVAFDEPGGAQGLIDLSEYSSVYFKVKCTPKNVLVFHLHSLDPRVTDKKNFSSYRISEKLFSCDKNSTEVEIDLHHMAVATWWLETFNLALSDQTYSLHQVAAMSISALWSGPSDISASVEISGLVLRKRNWYLLWSSTGLLVLIWLTYTLWLMRVYTRSLLTRVKDKLQKDRLSLVYRHVHLEPHKDKEKDQIIQFVMTEYKNPDMSMEMAINALGVNRSKINEILKEELGLTFNSCINKLRLVEAAHLLSTNEGINVGDVAFAVGYSDPSYFNKLFKNEYGCTPKTYKNISHSTKGT